MPPVSLLFSTISVEFSADTCSYRNLANIRSMIATTLKQQTNMLQHANIRPITAYAAQDFLIHQSIFRHHNTTDVTMHAINSKEVQSLTNIFAPY